MLNYSDVKLNSLIAYDNWDDHTANSDLQELLEGWRVIGVQLLKDSRGFTTDCIFIMQEPNGQIRAVNISNPTQSKSPEKTPGYLRIQVERLPGEPPLMRPRKLLQQLERLAANGVMKADERQEWYISGKVSRTEYEAIESAAYANQYEELLNKLVKNKSWDVIFRYGKKSQAALSIALRIEAEHAQEINPAELLDFVLYAINCIDYRSEDLRRILQAMPTDGGKDLPAEYNSEVLEVYKVTHSITEVEGDRLGEVPLWTYKREDAERLYKIYDSGQYGAQLYRGQLKRADVMGVMPIWGELLQLDSVYNIELIKSNGKGVIK